MASTTAVQTTALEGTAFAKLHLGNTVLNRHSNIQLPTLTSISTKILGRNSRFQFENIQINYNNQALIVMFNACDLSSLLNICTALIHLHILNEWTS